MSGDHNMYQKPRSYDDDTQYDEAQVQAMIRKAVRDEREACAKACEEVESRAEELWDKFAYPEDQGMASGARQCTTAIRARNNSDTQS